MERYLIVIQVEAGKQLTPPELQAVRKEIQLAFDVGNIPGLVIKTIGTARINPLEKTAKRRRTTTQ